MWMYWKDSLIGETLKEIETGPDRVAGIVAGSLLEDQLLRVLKDHMIQDDKVLGEMFQGVGPLATHSSRVKLAYLLQIIDEVVMKDLIIIKDIRNLFAHSLEPLSFGTQKIQDKCKNLKLIDNTTFSISVTKTDGTVVEIEVIDEERSA
jgi:DNA-binding MltR family transcriptional regulator